MITPLKFQSGFTLITTLFIVVVLGLLGSYMSLIASAQHQETAMSAQGVRAWYAANSGLEWAAYQIKTTGSCPVVPSELDIEGFSVKVNACTPYSVTEGDKNYTVHDVVILAERSSYGSVDYVSRSLRATLGGS